MGKWHLIQNQQRLREIFKEPPLISYRKGKSLKDLLVREKLWRSYYFQHDLLQESCDARRLVLTTWKVKLRAKWPILPELITVSGALNSLEYFYSPLDGMLVYRRVIPLRRYPFIHLGGERHCESEVSCPRTQRSAPARVRTRTVRSKVQRTNH